MSIAERIWWSLPARRSRKQVTTAAVIANQLGIHLAQITDVMADMQARGEIISDASGWHRGRKPQQEDRC